jgi:Flp pilus assembly pilin Flp
MERIRNVLRRAQAGRSLLGDERGLTTVEYVVILVLIAVMAIGVWRTFGGKVQGQVTKSSEAIEGLDSKDAAPGSK